MANATWSYLQNPFDNVTKSNNAELLLLIKGVNNNSIPWNDIDRIANQCKFVGGSPIARARAINEFKNPNSYYDEGISCLNWNVNGKVKVNSTGLDIMVFPNPADGFINVALPKYLFDKNTQISIINIFGQELKRISTNDTQLQIDISDLSSGIYFVNILNVVFDLKTSTKVIINR